MLPSKESSVEPPDFFKNKKVVKEQYVPAMENHSTCGRQNHAIREFRIPMPLSVAEYQVGQLWSVAEVSKSETGGGEGVEVRVNEPFTAFKYPADPPLRAKGETYTTGQYTHKVYHVKQKVPAFIRMIMPKGSMAFHEQAWNAYPYNRTVITNPDFLKENFYVIIESFHAPDNGSQQNVHDLIGRDFHERTVVFIDVANDKLKPHDYKAEWDPTLHGCPSAKRPPLPKDGTGEWMSKQKPIMCCYKLVKVWFKWFGIQKKVESHILHQEHRLFTSFHRQVCTWQEKYHSLTMTDIRRIESDTRRELEHERAHGQFKGMVPDE